MPADRDDLLAERREADEEKAEDGDRQRDEDRGRNAERRAGEDRAEHFVDAVDRLAVGVDEREAAQDAERAERDDEVRQLQLGDENAVEEPAGEPDREPGADAEPAVIRQDAGGDHAADADHRADGEVDTLVSSRRWRWPCRPSAAG